MTAGYILVIVMLILGGVIATLSDRLGTKVGKARLSLFKLRPRNTAVLVTVLTGSILSATTLGILFAASKPLRTGVFGIDEIQKRLNTARKELNQTTQAKNQVEAELAKAREAQAQARASLDEINRSLEAANAEQAETEAKLNSLRTQLNRVEAAKSRTQEQLSRVEAARTRTESQLDRTQSQLKTVSKQKRALGAEIAQLQAEQEELREQGERVKAQITQRDRDIAQQEKDIAQRDRAIAQQDRNIAQRDRDIAQRNAEIAQRDRFLQEREQAIAERDLVIAEREALLKELGEEQASLEDQQAYLQQQVQILERDFQAIRSGTVAIRRGQILAAGVVRILEPPVAQQAVDRLLQEANRATVRLIQPGKPNGSEQVIDITKAEVEQLMVQIKDGQDYVVRILAGANYLQGEKRIQVFAEAEINRVVFRGGDVVAGTTINPSNLTDEDVRKKLEKLIDACNFRANFMGIVGGRVQIADDKIETLLAFIEQLQQYDRPLDVQAIAADVTYTAGPLKINLVAIDDGVVLFGTGPVGSGKGGAEKIDSHI
ncbi:DUF3084 domain-containing protein [Kamptonema animale CS-326]|jgi:uncharacterized protein (DUF3084 family)|uniref:DUF3084 domain-containing protein n=1 Tax=Kamptonema animale TaxID=92934 RepID=UPI002330079A|nr:DUF3084 domain-containing protein [Kamptonema animale]MDB9510328.1 DUF3084 domain-containing protein [Kamptonema animale CS-326]